MTRIKNFASRYAPTFVVAFICLGGTATAASLITGDNIVDGSVTGADIKRGSVSHRKLSEGVWKKIKHADSRATGARGHTGSVGPPGTQGAKGDTGAAGAVGAAGAFVVKDANDVTAGTLLGSVTTLNLTFDFAGHTFTANASSGAPNLPHATFRFLTNDCTGPPLTTAIAPLQTALRSDPGDPGVYVMTGAASTQTVQSGLNGAGGCSNANTFVLDVYSIRQLAADELPPTLTGPLHWVPAG
jgi:hypothetical protein